MARAKSRKPRPPLDGEKLKELALAYVGRFATTRSKLATYLARKVREVLANAEQSRTTEEA